MNLGISNATLGNPRRLYNGVNNARLTYLHADKGNSAFLTSFLDNTFVNLRGCNDGVSIPIITGSSPIFSQCHASGDQYFLVHRITTQGLRLKTIRATSTTITTERDVGVASATGAAIDNILNSAVATDADGRVLVLWTRGGSADPSRTLEYKLFDAALATIDSGLVITGVSDPARLWYYDDASVTSYAPGAFAVASWNPHGVYLHDMRWNGSGMTMQSSIVAPGAGNAFCAVATNGRLLVIAWKGDLNGDGRRAVEGLRYRINGGRLALADPDTFCFSSASVSLSSPADSIYNPSLNVAMDAMGSIAFVWSAGAHANACVWADRRIYYSHGWWVSPVQTLAAAPNDSICIIGGAVTADGLSYGTVYDSVRVGTDADPANISAWSAWTSLNDPGALTASTKTVGRYLQYKIAIARNPADSLGTPVVRSIAIQWNAQPRFIGIDSLRIGSRHDRAVSFGDTVRCFSRIDSIGIYYRVHDTDVGDSVFARLTLWNVARDTLTKATDIAAGLTMFAPAPTSDSLYTLWFNAVDRNGWEAPKEALYLAARNDAPRLTVHAIYDTGHTGERSAISLNAGAVMNVQQGDSIEFFYMAADSNDPGIKARLSINNVEVDSAALGVERRFVFRAIRSSGYGGLLVRFSAEDPDTTVELAARIVVNHAPIIDTVRIGRTLAVDGDTVRVAIGAQTNVSVIVNDSDRFFWDTLKYRFTAGRTNATQGDSIFVYEPAREDASLRIIVEDLFGLSDTLVVYLKYPWFSTDPAENPAYHAAKIACVDSLELIAGSAARDTVSIALRNDGNDTMSIIGAAFSGSSARWLQVELPQGGSVARFDSLKFTDAFKPISLQPGEKIVVRVIVNGARLKGDGYVYDTLILATSDFAHPLEKIPVRLEHNELPRLINVHFDFRPDQPYWLGKKAVDGRIYQGYDFPPYSRIALTFSEPMDTLSAAGAIRAYSLLDSAARGSVSLIALDRVWNADYTMLFLKPRYTEASAHFAGLLPPAGAFIPTDSIALILSSSITDQAQTPHGPNGLDVHRDFVRDKDADTIITLRVDSITFDLVEVSPGNSAVSVPIDAAVKLQFNAPLFPGTIDTSRVNNRTLHITSRYNKGRLIAFDSVRVNGSTATFYPIKQFYFGDTVRCRYFGSAGRDMLGYSADCSGNGIAVGMFDSAAKEDDRLWSFVTQRNPLRRAFPNDGDTGVPGSHAIELIFAGNIFPGVIDTARSGNRTLIVTSGFSGKDLTFDSISITDSIARFKPSVRFYYGDSIRCLYTGLVTADTAAFIVAPENAGMSCTGDSIRWRFTVRTIGIRSVTPADRSANAGTHASISVRFTDKIYPGAIDVDSLVRNRSLTLMSDFSIAEPLPLRKVQISADSMSVTFTPAYAFFSSDTVRCTFSGFPRTYDYAIGTDFFTATADRLASKSWLFFAEGVGFYVYPNPYKPKTDSRHCGDPQAPCGIVFKNLHAIPGALNQDLRIRILTMKGYPIFDTQKAGEPIQLFGKGGELHPQWKWDARNQNGEEVATGLYFYAIAGAKDKTLKKGKLLIVR